MLNERELTKKELEKREEFIKDLKGNKRGFVKRYGKDAEKIMYAIATKRAKKQNEEMNKDKIREMIKSSLQGPVSEKKGKDLDGDGDIDSQDYLAARDAAIKKAKAEKVDEMDINDPVAMKMRAAKMKAANAGDDGNDKFFEKNAARLSKLKALKDKRAEIMRDMEQEAEMEGGPIADRYGDMLNKIDKAIDLLRTPEEREYTLRENSGDKEEGLMELRNIIDEASVLGDQARQVFSQYFPSMLSKAEAYGVFDFVESSNRYDTTLVSMAEEIEEYYDEEDEDMMQEDLDLGHQDNEPHMLKGDLYRIGKYAMELYQMVDKFEGQGEVDFPHWWQSKVIKAKDALVGAKHYLDFEIKEPQIDAMVDVAQEEDVIDEVELPSTTAKKANTEIKSAPTMAKALLQMYKQLQSGEQTDFSKNSDFKIVLSKLEKLSSQVKEDLDENAYIAMMAANAAKKGKDKKPVKEGTWSVGSSEDIKSVMDALDQMMGLKNPKDIVRYLSKLDKFLYNTVGDDIFHDDIDGAKREASEGNMDRAQNRLSDAYSRAAFFLERQMDREGFKESKLNEEDPGEADMIASDIQKALNKHGKDAVKTFQILQARKAMNKGDLDKAKKIVSRYLEEGLPKGYWDKKMDAKDEVSEDYDSLVNKIKKQGKSEKAAKAIAGAVASYKAKGGGKGPTAKQKK